MNIENVQRLRLAVEQAHFCDMKDGDNCLFGICKRIPEFVAEYRVHGGASVCVWLGITMREGWLIYAGYPRVFPPEGWRSWMLARLDRILETGVVEPWDAPRPSPVALEEELVVV